MINTTEDHKPKDSRFYPQVREAFNSLNNNELARLGFLELGMDPTEWVFLSDIIATYGRNSNNSNYLKKYICTNGFEHWTQPINLTYVASPHEEMNWRDVKESSDLSDSFQTEKFRLRYNAAKKNLEERNLPTEHIEVAKRYLDSRTSNPELFHNFKDYWRGHESQKSLITYKISLVSTAASFPGLATGIYFQRKLTGEIADAIQETGGKCAALNKIRSGGPRALSTSKVYEAGQCIEGAAQQEHFYGAVEHNVFWANASMAVGCAGMVVMVFSAMALFKGLSGSRKH